MRFDSCLPACLGCTGGRLSRQPGADREDRSRRSWQSGGQSQWDAVQRVRDSGQPASFRPEPPMQPIETRQPGLGRSVSNDDNPRHARIFPASTLFSPCSPTYRHLACHRIHHVRSCCRDERSSLHRLPSGPGCVLDVASYGRPVAWAGRIRGRCPRHTGALWMRRK